MRAPLVLLLPLPTQQRPVLAHRSHTDEISGVRPSWAAMTVDKASGIAETSTVASSARHLPIELIRFADGTLRTSYMNRLVRAIDCLQCQKGRYSSKTRALTCTSHTYRITHSIS